MAMTNPMQTTGFSGTANTKQFPEAGNAVSWASILCGAFAAAALSLVLLLLGSGLGFSSLSPWANDGASAKAIGIAAAIWLMLMSAIASALGGYLAGRLRTRWVDVHTDEVFFRDTAHGFLSWAIATLLTATLLTSAVSALIGGVAKVGASAVGTAASEGAAALGKAAADASPDDYFVDLLLRSGSRTPGTSDAAAVRLEVGRIFTRALKAGELAPADKTYLAQVIAGQAGITPAEAEQRVTKIVAEAKMAAAEAETTAREAADAARKAAAKLSLWLFVSLMIGAFSGSYAATIGGRQRDHITH